GTRKFFVEAKKPSVNLKDDIHPAFQLRRYSWSAKLPLGILTDFEELAVYDGRIKPEKADKASKARVKYLTYDKYIDRWNEVATIFSREEVLKGSFDKYVESSKAKRGTAEVDAAFLKEIETWREFLARNISLRNPDHTTRELNFAVQRTIDRMAFLRICEDRGIEKYGWLQSLLKGKRVYPRLCEFFHRADERYNSGLFHFKEETGRGEPPDELTLNLEIDDKPLKDIIKNLYYPDSPYEFSVLPPEILGHVYEQFLGKVITLTPGHRVKVEDKPEVRKAGGVYYTPTYIVDYIVENTVGKLLEGAAPKTASELKILDPACGSGSFLIGAYQHLLDWHRDWYVENLVLLMDSGSSATSKEVQALLPEGYAVQKKKGRGRPKKNQSSNNIPIFETQGGDWKLTTEERKRILLNNIYGVDIDPQAVEVTKLSLHIKVLEGESEETLSKQLKLFQERALPDLGENVKCGNSLIGPDFYDGQTTLTDEEELYRVNPFDWEAEFSEVVGRGGFDAVIGNPPYIRIQAMKQWAPLEVEFYKERYEAAKKGNYDIYVVFVERGLSLLNDRGLLGFILPHKFFNAKYGQSLRCLIAEGRNLEKIVHFGHEQVFTKATTYTCLLFLKKSGRDHLQFVKVEDLAEWRSNGEAAEGAIRSNKIDDNEWNFVIGSEAALFERLKEIYVKLGDVARIFQGLVTGSDNVYILEEIELLENDLVRVKSKNGTEFDLEQDILKSFIRGLSLSSYEMPKSRHKIIFPYSINGKKVQLLSSDELKGYFPNTWEYLCHCKNTLCNRENGKWNHEGWYAYGRTQNLAQMKDPKLVVQVISLTGRYAYDDDEIHFTGGGNGPYYGLRWSDPEDPHSLHYLQALLNSPLLDFYLHQISTTFRGGYWSYGKRFIEQLPIHTIDFSDPEDVARHDRMVQLVENMLELNKKLADTKAGLQKTLLQRQIEATDRQIDQLVYELYGLTEDEIKIVEDATAT
ncbi:MAG: Eco57I restriction-modification methylase domain-containing protein, partial [Methanotrichaceae archaeon]